MLLLVCVETAERESERVLLGVEPKEMLAVDDGGRRQALRVMKPFAPGKAASPPLREKGTLDSSTTPAMVLTYELPPPPPEGNAV